MYCLWKGSDGDGKGRMTSKEEEVKKREAEKRKFEKVSLGVHGVVVICIIKLVKLWKQEY